MISGGPVMVEVESRWTDVSRLRLIFRFRRHTFTFTPRLFVSLGSRHGQIQRSESKVLQYSSTGDL